MTTDRHSAAFHWARHIVLPFSIAALTALQFLFTNRVASTATEADYSVRESLLHALVNVHALCRANPGICVEEK